MEEQTTPVSPETQNESPNEPTNEPAVEQPAEQQTPPAQETPQEPTEPEEDSYVPSLGQPETPAFDVTKLPMDENGIVDLNAFAKAFQQYGQTLAQSVKQEAVKAIEEQRAEERLWNRAVDKFPDLKKDRELRDEIQNLRLGELARSQGKTWLTPTEAANRLYKRFGVAREEGMKQATESKKVQSSAYVETASRKSEPVDRQKQLMEDIKSRDPNVSRKAQAEYLKLALFGE